MKNKGPASKIDLAPLQITRFAAPNIGDHQQGHERLAALRQLARLNHFCHRIQDFQEVGRVRNRGLADSVAFQPQCASKWMLRRVTPKALAGTAVPAQSLFPRAVPAESQQ
jgi:hypothetical protein